MYISYKLFGSQSSICRGLIVLILMVCGGGIFLINQPADIQLSAVHQYFSSILTSKQTFENATRTLEGALNPGKMPTPILKRVSCRRINLSLTHPQLSIVAVLDLGRLGNQLSNFATCYAIWKEYGMYHHLRAMQLKLIRKVFDLPTFEEEDNNAPYYLWNPGKYRR